MATRTRSESRFLTQIVLVVLVVVGIVAGITFMAQYQPSRPDTPLPPPPPAADKDDLVFPYTPNKQANWEPPSAGEFEVQSPGHYDFWFKNQKSSTIRASDLSRSCKCTSVHICFFAKDDEAANYVRWAQTAAASEIGMMSGGLPALLQQMELDKEVTANHRGAKLTWHVLQTEKEGGSEAILLPPQCSGIVRANWDGKRSKVGPERLTITFFTQPQQNSPSARSKVQLEVPVTFLPLLRVIPETANLDELGYREEKMVEFLAWSSTRAVFPLSAKERSGDPCFACSSRPMTDQERSVLTERAGGSPVRFGHVVQVRVKERQSDSVQMDLGPFARHILLHVDDDSKDQTVTVTGVVRGEVTVGTAEDKGKVALGTFRVRNGTSKTIPIRAEVPGLKLRQDDIRIEPESLSYLKVQLHEDKSIEGKGRWKLRVDAPPGSPAGILPEHSAIFLKLPGAQPRYVRIPVTGLAYQQ